MNSGTEITVYRDEDKLGRGEFYSYISSDGHIVANFGGFATYDEAKFAAVESAYSLTVKA